MRLKFSISEPVKRPFSLRVRERFGALMIPTLKNIQRIQKGEIEVWLFYLSHAFHEVVFKHPKACLCLCELLCSIDNLRLHMRIIRLWASIHRQIHPHESRSRNQIYSLIHPPLFLQKKSDRRCHIYADRTHFVPSLLLEAMETHRQEKRAGKRIFRKQTARGIFW